MSRPPIDHLSEDEAWDIIRTTQIGRVATGREGAPDVHPVTYVLHNWKIYFRTETESRLRAETNERLVAFEAAYQMMRHIYSTVALGVARTLTDTEVTTLLDQLPIVQHAPDQEYVWMEIDPNEVRGRRLTVLDPQK
jgi:nitroimidazol reductase NimA-like FMN-containing flavoprotein (pyridoxamine 5'-phosphate oxidase superfamily)